MNLEVVAERLKSEREVTFTAHGASMTPRIRHGESVTVERVNPQHVKKGDIVLAQVGRRLYLHQVSASERDRLQISNNHGHVNGWTLRRKVLGRLKQ